MAVLQKCLPIVEKKPSATRCEFCGVPLIEIRMTMAGKAPIETLAYCECRILADESASRFAAEKARILAVKENVGARFGDATFQNWNSSGGRDEMLAIAEDYARRWPEMETQGLGLFIHGSPGSGKTHLVAALGLHLMRLGVSVAFWPMQELLDRLRATYGGASVESEHEILTGLERSQLLIIDDVAATKTTEWAEGLFYSVVDKRYRQKKPLIVTTNVTPQKLRETLGERTASRLDEICLPICNSLSDYRRKIAQKR